MFRVWDSETQRYNITGIPTALKSTQEYPIGFGRAVAQSFREHATNLQQFEAEDLPHPDQHTVNIADIMTPSDVWADADMEGVLGFVTHQCTGDACACAECAGQT